MNTWIVTFAYSGCGRREFFDIEFTTNNIDREISEYVWVQNKGEAKSDRIRLWEKKLKTEQ